MSDAIEHIASTDPVIAYRAWQVTGGLLGSVATGSAGWPRCRPMHAVCPVVNAATEYHTAPGEDCSCGLYAMKTVEALAKTLHYGPQIIGRVALWGEIIEHDEGYRAEYAYPQVLFYDDKAFTKSAALAVASAYGCEVAPMPKELADAVPAQVQAQRPTGVANYGGAATYAAISVPYGYTNAIIGQILGQQGAAQGNALAQSILASHGASSAMAQYFQNKARAASDQAELDLIERNARSEIRQQIMWTAIFFMWLTIGLYYVSHPH